MFEKILDKNKSDDRILVLAPIQGLKAMTGTGLVDTKLFTGGNKLHAIKDPQSYMWTLRYENGTLPQKLRQKFTGFETLLKYATIYFKRRNINIIRVED